MLPTNLLLQNRYRIIRLISYGCMDDFYEAMDERLHHPVTIKRTVYSNEQTFAHNAHCLAQLQHPALPKISDHFTEEAAHFLVMEFIDGDDAAPEQV